MRADAVTGRPAESVPSASTGCSAAGYVIATAGKSADICTMKRGAGYVICLAALCLVPAALVPAAGLQEGGALVFHGVEGIELDAGIMNVEILPSGTETVTFATEGLWEQGRVRHEVGEVLLRISAEQLSDAAVFGRDPGTARLSVPTGVVMRIFTSSGSVAVKGVFTDRITVRSRDGDITVSEASSAFDLRTTTGSITIDNAVGGKILSTSTGEISVTNSSGNIEATGPVGSHRYERIRGSLYVQAGTGDVDVNLMRGPLRIYASAGDITCRSVFITDDSDFRANAGNISVELLNEFPLVGFELSTLTGSIAVGDRLSDGTLVVNERATLDVTGRAALGRQEYRFRRVTGAERSGGFDPTAPDPLPPEPGPVLDVSGL